MSASWDGTAKVWDPHSDASVLTCVPTTDDVPTGSSNVYRAAWSPHSAGIFATVSADGALRIWDCRSKGSLAAQTLKAHAYEVLTCDWNKYREGHVVTGSVDQTARGFDLRAGPEPLFVLEGHRYAVRQIRCSPFSAAEVATASYDFTVRTWNTDAPPNRRQGVVFSEHTEFAVGLDYSLHTPGLLVDCAWDRSVHINGL